MIKNAKSFVTAAVLGLLTACGGSSVVGTVKGNSLNVQDSIFLSISTEAGAASLLAVYLGDKPGLCDKLKANQNPKDLAAIGLVLAHVDSMGHFAPIETGTYSVGNPDSTHPDAASASFAKLDSACASTVTSASTGSVKLESYSDKSHVSGTFDLNFNPDHVTGTFNANYCDVTLMGGTPTCI